MSRIAFIGAGAMAEAVLKQILAAGGFEAGEIILSDVDVERLQQIHDIYGAATERSNRQAASQSETVILAVKPQKLGEVLREIADCMDSEKTVISIAMGKSISFIEGFLPEGIPVVRVMPNNPAMVGAAVSVLSYGRSAGEEARGKALAIFSCLGEVYELDEKMQDEAMALSGCGPAYFYVFAEALADAGVRLGLERSLALKLATGTMIGSGKMLRDSGLHPSELKDMVTSPGGSTIAALEAMEEGGLRGIVYRALRAARERAKEV